MRFGEIINLAFEVVAWPSGELLEQGWCAGRVLLTATFTCWFTVVRLQVEFLVSVWNPYRLPWSQNLLTMTVDLLPSRRLSDSLIRPLIRRCKLPRLSIGLVVVKAQIISSRCLSLFGSCDKLSE